MPRPVTRRHPKRDHAATLVRQDDGSVWRPDAAISISFSPNYQITDHPVESGVTVSDHVQQQPNSITLTAIVSENPTRIGGVVGGRVHLQEQFAWLFETAAAVNPLVDIVTRRLGVFKGYAIQSFPTSIDKVARLEFQITLRELRVATAQLVFIAVEDVTVATSDESDVTDDEAATEAGAPDEIDTGEQATTSTEGTEAEEEDQSILAGLLDAL